MREKKKEPQPTLPIKELDKVIDRESAFPCRLCRKRDSCIVRPYDGRCTGLDKGTPWSVLYSAMQNN